MNTRGSSLLIGLSALLTLGADSAYAHRRSHEVWVTEQSGTAGTLYIYDGEALREDPGSAVPEVVDLGAAVAPFCLAQTGTAPTRAHMLSFNADDRYAILSYVATGHVAFIRAATRAPVACIDVGVQAHAAFAAPDDSYVVVANQNGKLLQRILTDYDAESFVLDAAGTINLAACTTPSGAPCEAAGLRPDNAPICPVIASDSRLVFVTLRGGGLFVVDGKAPAMTIVSEYDMASVRGNGCGGVETRGRMYLNAGGGTGGNPTENTLYSFDLDHYPEAGATPPNTPAPRQVYALDDAGHDAHGMLVSRPARGRYVWVGDRFSNEVLVVDTRGDRLVNVFSLAGLASSDPAPDLMSPSPDGAFAYVALRGPCPLTANVAAVNNAVGATPGVGVIKVRAAGRRGELIGVAPISSPSAPFTCTTVGGSPTLTERADPHGLAVRRK